MSYGQFLKVIDFHSGQLSGLSHWSLPANWVCWLYVGFPSLDTYAQKRCSLRLSFSLAIYLNAWSCRQLYITWPGTLRQDDRMYSNVGLPSHEEQLAESIRSHLYRDAGVWLGVIQSSCQKLQLVTKFCDDVRLLVNLAKKNRNMVWTFSAKQGWGRYKRTAQIEMQISTECIEN